MQIKSELDPSFHLIDTKDHLNPVNGVHLLNPALTINGITVLPFIRYIGKYATSTFLKPWGYGEVLDLQAGTAPTYNAGSPLLGPMDDSVLFNAGGYYMARNLNFGNVGTNDYVVECVFQAYGTAYACLASKRGNGPGYQFGVNDGFKPFTLNSIGGATTITCATSVVLGAWYHMLIFCDRSNNTTIFINGVSDAEAATVKTVSVDIDQPFVIGADSLGAKNYGQRIAYLAIYQGAAWLDTSTQTAIASERFAKLTGAYPKQARGTALASTATRSCVASIEKKDDKNGLKNVYQVGTSWMRLGNFIDSNGLTKKGLITEPSVANQCARSEDWTNWSFNNASAVANQLISPDGSLTADKMLTDSDEGGAWSTLYIGVQGGAVDNTPYCFSTYIKNGNHTVGWVSLTFFDNSIATIVGTWFNLITGLKGTTTGVNVLSSGIEDKGNGWYRPWITFQSPSYAGGTVHVSITNTDGNRDDPGDGIYVYLWGAQTEVGYYPSSYIKANDGATVTRLADSLQYSGLANIGNVGSNRQGRVEFDFCIPNHNIISAYDFVRISDAGSANDMIKLSITADDFISLVETSTLQAGATITNSSDIANGICHKAVVTWENNLIKLSVDGVLIGTNTTCGLMPDALSQINIDTSLGIVSNLKIYPFAKPIGEK